MIDRLFEWLIDITGNRVSTTKSGKMVKPVGAAMWLKWYNGKKGKGVRREGMAVSLERPGIAGRAGRVGRAGSAGGRGEWEERQGREEWEDRGDCEGREEWGGVVLG